MPTNVNDVIASSAYNKMQEYQTDAKADNNQVSMDDFWRLMAAQLQYQDMTNPMSNSEMMNQMTQMATMNAMNQVTSMISNFGIVINNLSQVTLTGYSTSMIGREVTVAVQDENGKVTGEKKGIVTGVDLTGAQYIYIDGEKYSLTQIMSVGEIPKKEDGDKVEKPEEVPGTGDEDKNDGADNGETPDAGEDKPVE